MSPRVPTWFTQALAESYDSATVDVCGVSVSYRVWGKVGAPPAVLVHGGAAHAGWWDHIAPHLTAEHRIIAIDLSGHGDSGRGAPYTLDGWSDQVLAAARAESDEPPILFGHSMGGFVVLTAAQRHGSALRGVAAIDSPVRETSPEARAWDESGRHVPGNKTYPDRDTILARFRTLPEDGASLPYVRDHLAAGSIIEVDGGWTWKFDPQIFFHSKMEPEDLVAVGCRVALIRGERGLASRDITDAVAERLGGDVPVTVIPDAGHHIMLDQPIALIATLQTLLGQWSSPNL